MKKKYEKIYLSSFHPLFLDVTKKIFKTTTPYLPNYPVNLNINMGLPQLVIY